MKNKSDFEFINFGLILETNNRMFVLSLDNMEMYQWKKNTI